MELQEIEVVIEKDGRVRLEVRGVKGRSCLSLTEPLEKLLGGSIETRTMRPEAEETPNRTTNERDVRRGSA